MKIVSIHYKGYIGFMAGLGVHELDIDLSKSKYNITIIKAANGKGKSTLLNTLHFYPDDNNYFIPNEPASKTVVIDDDGIPYKFHIISGIKKNGDRETTKAHIFMQDLNGEWEDLNPNGNVTSYKDTLESRFSLDPNFIYLSKLSCEDRGIVDKKPAERKKFVSTIISSLEVYNNMYKVLNKKSSIFKSMKNTILNKIGSAADIVELKSGLVNIENQLTGLNATKEQLISQLGENKASIKLVDPDGKIQETYNSIGDKIKKLNSDIDINKINGRRILESLEGVTQENINKKYKECSDAIRESETSIRVVQSKMNSILQEKEDESKSIQMKSAKLASMQISDGKDLESKIEANKKTLESYKNLINTIGISENITSDEFVLGLNTLNEIKESVLNIYSSVDNHILSKSVSYCLSGTSPDLLSITNRIEELKKLITECSINIEKYNGLLKTTEKLQLRDKNCTISSCMFIKDALEAQAQNPGDRLKIEETNIDDYRKELSILEVQKEEMVEISSVLMDLDLATKSLMNHANIINKLPVPVELFKTKKSLLDAIMNNYDFKEVEVLYQYLQYANIIEEYKALKELNAKLIADKQVYNSKEVIAKGLIEELDVLNKKMHELDTQMEEFNNDISNAQVIISEYKDTLVTFDTLISIYNKDKEYQDEKQILFAQYKSIKDNMDSIRVALINIDRINAELGNIKAQIEPLNRSREKIIHTIELSKEFESQLADYNTKLEKIEVLKKYSTPTKDGIQLLFMEMYMNDILTMTNELLKYFFNGEYFIEKFIINDKEFSIPCIGERLRCNDISYMSMAQKCMISMIIQFALFVKSSPKYNIIRLDEIDCGLDENGRLMFFPVLNELISKLNISQMFIISHNQEIDQSQCNIIKLGDIEGITNPENIIFEA